MTANKFGGIWTQAKLDVLREYLAFYVQALKNTPFELIYIDAFAGTGRCHIRDGTDGGALIDGSAKLALDVVPPFSHYHFIEPKRSYQSELEALIAQHANGARATLAKISAQDVLPYILLGRDWRRTRGVLFLDPYGLQCSWQLIQQIARTQALDVFFLVSLSGLFRLAAVKERELNRGHAAKLDAVLGTTDWRSALYTVEQTDMFDAPEVSREGGWRKILNFMTGRLRSAFPYVGEPMLLGDGRGAPLFALYFMVSNPDPRAIGLASRVSRDVLSKLR